MQRFCAETCDAMTPAATGHGSEQVATTLTINSAMVVVAARGRAGTAYQDFTKDILTASTVILRSAGVMLGFSYFLGFRLT